MALSFERKDATYLSAARSIGFTGSDHGKTARCRVSGEALEDAVRARELDEAGLLSVFQQLRAKVEVIASHKYVRDVVEADGSVLVRTEDFNR